MIIEACILNPESTTPQPLTMGYYPNIDTLNFELSDLITRPRIITNTSRTRYRVELVFANAYTVDVQSPYKELARHVLRMILLDIDVLESNIRATFPELMI